jgi:hypothetical protein
VLWEITPKGLQELKAPFRVARSKDLANAQTVADFLKANPDVRPEIFHKAWAAWLIRETRALYRPSKKTETRKCHDERFKC